jgi:hypothetical protein
MPPIELELNQMINADSGVPLVVNGAATGAYIIPMLDGSTELNGEVVEHSGPYAMAIMAEIKALDLSAGDDGDLLTIGGSDYVLLAVDSDGHGGALLRLAEQP